MGAAAHARQQGMKFPPINFEDIANLPPQECLVFEDKNDLYCPIVIWITLCNKAFKSQKDFKPRDQKYGLSICRCTINFISDFVQKLYRDVT